MYKNPKPQDLAKTTQDENNRERGRVFRYLAELGLKSGVDFVESATESGELLACLIGDQHLRHPFPIYGPSGLECDVSYFLARSAHFLS